jgi:hypothetical protein
MAKDKSQQPDTLEDALRIIEQLKAQAPQNDMSAALDKLAKIAENSQRVQASQLKQTAPRNNAQGPRTSPYNPRGEKDYPMPTLKCEMHMPFPSSPANHPFDREEVELLNLVEPGKYGIELNDGSVRFVVLNGRRNRLTGHVDSIRWEGEADEDSGHPTPLFTGHNKQEYPGLKVMLRQMLGEKKAFRDEENAEKYGTDESPAADVMPMRVEQRKIAAYLAADPATRDETGLAFTKHATAKHDGPLAISLGE